MNKLVVNAFIEKKIKNGIQLLDAHDFDDLSIDNQLIELFSKTKHFLGMAYLSQQNKGVGWFLSHQKITLDENYFKVLFETAKKQRSYYFQSNLTTAFRVFNQDGDNFGGLTIDLYGDYAIFSWYNLFVYQIKEMIIAAFKDIFPEIKGAYEKIRFKGLNYQSAHLYGQEAPETFIILENGVSYQVFLNRGLMTGIFLDQHEVREALVTHLSSGKKILNLFSYTAAFSVAASMGGAIETTSVDLANRSKKMSEAHFKANHFDLTNHQFIVMDVFNFLKYAKRHHLTYDVIIIDPPSFAKNKKKVFSVAKDYRQLISQSLPLLNDQGLIIASTNAANLSVAQFKKELEKGFGTQKHSYEALYQLPSDFRINKNDERSNYLKVFTIKVNK
ncbi:class I SAM-dependent rRNA methyltransferase [Streptococcus zalophi]|uniref:Class I SAM-dependent rRNA methyltransferase n=1 Tax=Streptococcus zalophi TaxID=640031 RepID=A0A934UCY8_9STRE|nr:class I SAM-dependent rRNA methyltransferase [Streptococcus zalophi]MBJ8349139.1 class I SAM-dependent rRNA methyltransferase [Streptococcus zalophi]MCR8967709.1 class I SAM-dependent rRNA methyltransferase [Streptococcus zalophi]